MPTRSICLGTLSLFEQGPGRSGRRFSQNYHGTQYGIILCTMVVATVDTTARGMFGFSFIWALVEPAYHTIPTMGVLPSTQPVATFGSSFIWSSIF